MFVINEAYWLSRARERTNTGQRESEGGEIQRESERNLKEIEIVWY